MHDDRPRRRRGLYRGPFGRLHPLADQRVDNRVELGTQPRIAEHDLTEPLPVQGAVRAEHFLTEGGGYLRQTGRAGHDHLPGGHVRVDEHRAVLRQPPGYLALARPDASGKTDPQQLQYLRSRYSLAMRGSAGGMIHRGTLRYHGTHQHQGEQESQEQESQEQESQGRRLGARVPGRRLGAGDLGQARECRAHPAGVNAAFALLQSADRASSGRRTASRAGPRGPRRKLACRWHRHPGSRSR